MGAYMGVSLQPAIHFGIFEEIKKRLLGGRKELTFMESFVYAGFARAVSTMLIYPYIRAKVLCQTGSGKARSSMEVIGEELKENGVVGLYAGIAPELIRGVMSTVRPTPPASSLSLIFLALSLSRARSFSLSLSLSLSLSRALSLFRSLPLSLAPPRSLPLSPAAAHPLPPPMSIQEKELGASGRDPRKSMSA